MALLSCCLFVLFLDQSGRLSFNDVIDLSGMLWVVFLLFVCLFVCLLLFWQ